MFSSTPPKGKNPKLMAKGPRKPQLDPNDTSIEGTLKLVLDDQSINETKEEQTIDIESVGNVDAPLIRLVNSVLIEAVKANASDIHIEPFETILRIRFRIDGELREIHKMPHKLTGPITSRLKIMCDLDICEKRIPQDGSFKFKTSEMTADFRLSTLPSAFGEKIVMRVMGGANVNNDLSKLGIPTHQLKLIRDAINKPDGLVLVTGPTGSGKTTTLYAALNELNDISVSVFTAEDPIEGNLPGVTQAQVNTAVGYTFAAILRSLLRQDPDVILVGEIRDQETAEISIKAALTGHLVLSTLHTNCAVSTISRLINMGVAPYLIASSVNCVVAQRLVRRICEECKVESPLPAQMFEDLGNAAQHLQHVTTYRGKGCPKCFNTGYKGRAPIYEILILSDVMRQMILAGTSRDDMRVQARQDGMQTLRESGFGLVEAGVTTLEEVLGVTNEDSEQQTVKPVNVATQVIQTDLSLSAQAAPITTAVPIVTVAQEVGIPNLPATEAVVAPSTTSNVSPTSTNAEAAQPRWKTARPTSTPDSTS